MKRPAEQSLSPRQRPQSTSLNSDMKTTPSKSPRSNSGPRGQEPRSLFMSKAPRIDLTQSADKEIDLSQSSDDEPTKQRSSSGNTSGSSGSNTSRGTAAEPTKQGSSSGNTSGSSGSNTSGGAAAEPTKQSSSSGNTSGSSGSNTSGGAAAKPTKQGSSSGNTSGSSGTNTSGGGGGSSGRFLQSTTEDSTILTADEREAVLDALYNEQDPVQQRVYDIFEHVDQCQLVLGKAGTGKTRVAVLAAHRLHTPILASSKAALQRVKTACSLEGFPELPAEQFATLHSFASLGLGNRRTPDIIAECLKIASKRANYIDHDRWFIDEASMLTAGVMDQVNEVAQVLRGNTREYGGITLCIVGDFYQLAPVHKNKNTQVRYLFEHTPIELSIAWKDGDEQLPVFSIVELTKNYRSGHDVEWSEALSIVRDPDLGTPDNIRRAEQTLNSQRPPDYLQEQIQRRFNGQAFTLSHPLLDRVDDAAQITTLRKERDDWQSTRNSFNPNPQMVFPSQNRFVNSKKSTPVTLQSRKKLQYEMMSRQNCPETLHLKVGARAMITKRVGPHHPHSMCTIHNILQIQSSMFGVKPVNEVHIRFDTDAPDADLTIIQMVQFKIDLDDGATLYRSQIPMITAYAKCVPVGKCWWLCSGTST